jgi:hypothetical protein
MADLVWTVPDAVRRLTDALPEPRRSRFTALLDDAVEDGPTCALVPA